MAIWNLRAGRVLTVVAVGIGLVTAATVGVAVSDASRPSSGEVVSAIGPGGHGTLALTARWTPGGSGHEELRAVRVRFSTCYRTGFLYLYNRCPGLTQPYFKIYVLARNGSTTFLTSTKIIQRYNVLAHESAWIKLNNPETGSAFSLHRKVDLMVQLWAYSHKTGTLAEVAQVRD
jgi:hypothetical protein